MRYLCVVLFGIVVGCGGSTFTNLGNGVAVPFESIDKYASEHGVTRAEARVQLRIESDNRRTNDHAVKYGISDEEAKRQLEHAANQQGGD
jgi:diaminopimelate decarboxylase